MHDLSSHLTILLIFLFAFFLLCSIKKRLFAKINYWLITVENNDRIASYTLCDILEIDHATHI